MVRLKCLKCINRSKHIQTNSGKLNSIIKNWREFVFITNNMESSAEKIAWLYKNRWRVQLFFKWTKQHLRIFFWEVPQWMQSKRKCIVRSQHTVWLPLSFTNWKPAAFLYDIVQIQKPPSKWNICNIST